MVDKRGVWPLLLGVTLAVSVGVTVAGWFQLSRAAYIFGLCLAGLVLALMVWSIVLKWRNPVRLLVLAGVIAALVAGFLSVGIGAPKRDLAAEFAGTGVQWRRDASDGDARLGSVRMRFGDSVVVVADHGTFLIDLRDGHTIAELPHDDQAEFSIAGDRLLVNVNGTFDLYDASGKSVWPKPIIAEMAVGHAQSVTVLETCSKDGCAVTGYDDRGRKVWTRDGFDGGDRTARFHEVLDLPSRPSRESSEVLGPAFVVATKELDRFGPYAWAALDAETGETLNTGRGHTAAVVDKKMVTLGYDGESCDVSISLLHEPRGEPIEDEVSCSSRNPVAHDGRLFVQNTESETSVVTTGGPPGTITAQPGVQLSYGDADYAPADASGAGIAYIDRDVVKGMLWDADEAWQFIPDAPAGPVVNERSAVVTSPTGRSNPLDPSAGYRPGQSTTGAMDYRVVVLDLTTGAERARMRFPDSPAVFPLGDGSAVVIAQGQMVLLGAAIG